MPAGLSSAGCAGSAVRPESSVPQRHLETAPFGQFPQRNVSEMKRFRAVLGSTRTWTCRDIAAPSPGAEMGLALLLDVGILALEAFAPCP